ncbi:MAG TPA: ABC transporter ATP-binding protein, partial [Flavobacterium sp.]|nr:ABC transporter ATP-binding protein [Flavobacterium sp.]
LRIQSVSYDYGSRKVLSEVSFSVKKGQSVALIGESGSGKSTLLKAIYGLLDLPKGTIFWKANQVLGPAHHLVPGMSYMKYLAQDFDLMPYVSVAENVGRFLSNFYLKEKAARIDELLELVGMNEFKTVQARYLSGGQMQRVALARVLALEPELLLLDEPFSHIDYHQKNELAQHVFGYCKEKGITVMYTSHTPEEILMFSDQVLVLEEGKVVGNDTPQHMYELPETAYIAQLTGEVNLIPVHYFGVQNDEILLIRPHQLAISEEGITGRVTACYYKGSVCLVKVQVDFQQFTFLNEKPIPVHSIVKFNIIKKRL